LTIIAVRDAGQWRIFPIMGQAANPYIFWVFRDRGEAVESSGPQRLDRFSNQWVIMWRTKSLKVNGLALLKCHSLDSFVSKAQESPL
jgi:hypothetical protein